MEIRIKVDRKGIQGVSNPHGKVFCCGIFREADRKPTGPSEIRDVLAWAQEEMEGFLKARKKKRA